MDNKAEPRVALVTGSSRGIGRACAIHLAEVGHDVVIVDLERQKNDLESTAKAIRALGRRAFVYFADVSNKADVVAMVGKAIADAGHIDIVVNNAGILIPGEVEALSEETWDAVMAVNAKGTFLVVQALLGHMKQRRYGRIVNIASIGGKHGAPAQSHYSASKAAIMGFTRVLAQEVGTFGITANCICPGIIVTDMGRTNLDHKPTADAWIEKTAMRRLGYPEDVAGPVAFFASDESAFVTGQTLNVCGGIVLS